MYKTVITLYKWTSDEHMSGGVMPIHWGDKWGWGFEYLSWWSCCWLLTPDMVLRIIFTSGDVCAHMFSLTFLMITGVSCKRGSASSWINGCSSYIYHCLASILFSFTMGVVYAVARRKLNNTGYPISGQNSMHKENYRLRWLVLSR